MAIPQRINNESNTSTMDNSLRPYTGGINKHSDQIATIVLFKTGKQAEPQAKKDIDYLNNLTNEIIALDVYSQSSGVDGFPETPGGNIAVLSLDNQNDYYGVFNNFSVTNVTESHDQIVKVHMNFSASWNAFFFGEAPKVYQFNGYFLDTADYPYYQEFMVAYNKYLCGRKAIEAQLQMKLMISGQILDGYLLNVNVNHDANQESLKQFRFTVLVKGSSWIRNNLLPSNPMVPESDNKLFFNGLSNVHRVNPSDGGVSERIGPGETGAPITETPMP